MSAAKTRELKSNELSSQVELLSKRYVKFAIEELLSVWIDKEKSCQIPELPDESTTKKFKSHGNKTNRQKSEWVWLQGYSINIAKDGDTFEISDSSPTDKTECQSIPTSLVLVTNCLKAPGVDENFKKKYCQGIFELSNS